MENDTSPILVTGPHRAGTTWVGSTLALTPRIAYLHELFNKDKRYHPGIFDMPVPQWYLYISDSNEKMYFPAMKKTMSFQYSWREEINSLRSWKDAGRMMRDGIHFYWLKSVIQPRLLIKDPFALFSAQWFSSQFNSEVVIIARHPAAYVSSILNKGWRFPFKDLLDQRELMRDQLQAFRSEIEEYVEHDKSIIDQAILLWRITHWVIDKYREDYPDWHIYRYEDIARDPVDVFQSMFNKLNIDWNDSIKQKIENTTDARNPVNPADTSIFNVRRDSRAIIDVWKERLRKEEIDYIRKNTTEIASRFYPDEKW